MRSRSEMHAASFRLAVEAEVPIAMGTDCPVAPHAWTLRELSLMAEHGLGAAGALRAATVDAARLLGPTRPKAPSMSASVPTSYWSTATHWTYTPTACVPCGRTGRNTSKEITSAAW